MKQKQILSRRTTGLTIAIFMHIIQEEWLAKWHISAYSTNRSHQIAQKRALDPEEWPDEMLFFLSRGLS
jgi:hypothetical protein